MAIRGDVILLADVSVEVRGSLGLQGRLLHAAPTCAIVLQSSIHAERVPSLGACINSDFTARSRDNGSGNVQLATPLLPSASARTTDRGHKQIRHRVPF